VTNPDLLGDEPRHLALLDRLDSDRLSKADLERLQSELPANSALIETLADLATLVQRHLLRHLPANALVRESICQTIAQLGGELRDEHDGPLEKMLRGNLLTCWIRLYLAERAYTTAMAGDLPPHEAVQWERRLSAAQARCLHVLAVLAQVHRLSNHTRRRSQGRFVPQPMQPVVKQHPYHPPKP